MGRSYVHNGVVMYQQHIYFPLGLVLWCSIPLSQMLQLFQPTQIPSSSPDKDLTGTFTNNFLGSQPCHP